MRRIAAALFIAVAFSGGAPAQGWPEKPVRFVVGFTPGGPSDILARALGQKLAESWAQQVVIENKPGAGGNIAAEMVAKSVPDGYTLLNATDKAVNMALYKSPGYSDKDFIGVSRVAYGPCVIVVNNDSPFRTLKELIDYAKANPEKL